MKRNHHKLAEHPIIPCLQCGEPFVRQQSRQKYCCEKCKRAYEKANVFYGGVKICAVCGRKYNARTVGQLTCSKPCLNEYRKNQALARCKAKRATVKQIRTIQKERCEPVALSEAEITALNEREERSRTLSIRAMQIMRTAHYAAR